MLTLAAHHEKALEAARQRAVAFTAELDRQNEVKSARWAASTARQAAETAQREVRALKALALSRIGQMASESAVEALRYAVMEKFVAHALPVLMDDRAMVNHYAHMAMHLWHMMDMPPYMGRGLFPDEVMKAFVRVAEAAKWDIEPRVHPGDRMLATDTLQVEYRIYWPERERFHCMVQLDYRATERSGR
jgi:hypothetical protein